VRSADITFVVLTKDEARNMSDCLRSLPHGAHALVYDAFSRDDTPALARFAATLEKVTVATVESGSMTKDLAILVSADQKWVSTTGFLDKVSENLKSEMDI